MPVMLDHLARPGQGTPEEYVESSSWASVRNLYMKFTTTGVTSASKEPYPHLDARPLVKRVYEAFGPDRMMWGELGLNMGSLARPSSYSTRSWTLCPSPISRKFAD